MTNMLPRDRAEQIMAEHAAGKPVRAIARTYGHSPGTVRDYVHGRRAPGEPAARASPQPGPTTSRHTSPTAGSDWPTTRT